MLYKSVCSQDTVSLFLCRSICFFFLFFSCPILEIKSVWTQQSKRKSNFEIYIERDIDIYLGWFFRFFVGFGFWVSFVRLFENDQYNCTWFCREEDVGSNRPNPIFK